MKCLVTGSDGFIGSHLLALLKKIGHDVEGWDIKSGKDFRLIDEEDLKGVDWVFHLGAASGSLHFLPDPIDGTNINCVGTLRLLDAAKKAGVKKVIFSSTGSSYGGTPLPHHEELPLNCPNFYTATKIFNEQSMKLYHDLYGLETVIFRFASVFGDNEDSKILPQGNLANVVSQFIWKMLKDESPEIWGTGKQTRDFIFVDDIVNALIYGAENLGGGQVYNVGTGVETTFTDLVGIINKVLNTDIKATYIPVANSTVQKNYVDRQLFDIDKLAQAGWRYGINLETGVRKIVENIRSRK